MNQIWKPQSHAGFPHISMSQLGEALPQGHAHVVSRRSMRQKVPGHSKVWFRWTSRGHVCRTWIVWMVFAQILIFTRSSMGQNTDQKTMGCCQALCSSNLYIIDCFHPQNIHQPQLMYNIVGIVAGFEAHALNF